TKSNDGNDEKSSARVTFVDTRRMSTATEMFATMSRSRRLDGNGKIITVTTSTITAGNTAWPNFEVFMHALF
ncbi:MAG: hypothetical protein ACI83Y_001902, partial [Candidatus Azotimanducaceae bacterium]